MGDLSTFDIRERITSSVIDTYGTMLALEVEPLAEEPPPGYGIHRLVGTLNFAGAVTGIFNLQVTETFGRLMAGRMLEQEPAEVDLATDVRDLLAEVTNIVGGNLKSALNDAGHPCVLSTPSITFGTDFTIRSLAMDRFERMAFRHGEHVFVVEAGLKGVEAAEAGLEFCTPEAMSRLPHVDAAKLEALDPRAKIAAAVTEVFETMFSLALAPVDTVSASSLQGKRLVSSVCFAGDATGVVSVHVGEELARRMAANMLGVEPGEIDDEAAIHDMLGELGNIVTGGLKSALTDTGLRCALSTPSVTAGTDFMIEALNLDRYERFAFEAGGLPVFAEMGFKISDLVKAAPRGATEVHYRVEETPAAGGEKPAAEAGRATPGRPAAREPSPAAQAAPPAAPHPGPAAPAAEAPALPEDFGLDLLVDIPVELTVELGRSRIPIQELLRLQPGSALKLSRLEGEPVDILANDVLIARGEVVVKNEKYGIRITEIAGRRERLRGLKD